jgi:hypothetical protein
VSQKPEILEKIGQILSVSQYARFSLLEKRTDFNRINTILLVSCCSANSEHFVTTKPKGRGTGKQEMFFAYFPVLIELDSQTGKRDRYGRLLAHVWLEDGISFNEQPITKGYAYFANYGNVMRYDGRYQSTQTI